MNTKLKASLFFTVIFLASSLSSWASSSNLFYGSSINKKNFMLELESKCISPNAKSTLSFQLMTGSKYYSSYGRAETFKIAMRNYLDEINEGIYYGAGVGFSSITVSESDGASYYGHGYFISLNPEIGYNLLVLDSLVLSISAEYGLGYGLFRENNIVGFSGNNYSEFRTDALFQFKIGFNGIPFSLIEYK